MSKTSRPRATSEGLDEKLQVLLDRQQILDCIHRCARGMDRHDGELIASAYHADAMDDHGTFRGSVANLVQWMNGDGANPGVHSAFLSHQHFVTNSFVDLDGDLAHAETYFLMLGRRRDGAKVTLATGRYVDRFERRESRWAIALRRVLLEWSAVLDENLAIVTDRLESFAHGTWGHDDISYERPTRVREGGE